MQFYFGLLMSCVGKWRHYAGRKIGIHSPLFMEYVNVETDNDGD